jgi:hypothetical protein
MHDQCHGHHAHHGDGLCHGHGRHYQHHLTTKLLAQTISKSKWHTLFTINRVSLHINIWFNLCINRKTKGNYYCTLPLWTSDSEDLDAPGTTTVSPHRHIHPTLRLTVLHMRYTSYLATVQHCGAAGSHHVTRDVKLYLIRMWGSVSKTRNKRKCLHLLSIKLKNT